MADVCSYYDLGEDFPNLVFGKVLILLDVGLDELVEVPTGA